METNELESSLSSQDAALLGLARALRDTGYRFSTITPLTQARVNRRPGNAWAKDLAGVFGWSRPFDSTIVPSSLRVLMKDADVLRPHEGGWRSAIRLSSLGQQLFVHSAYPTTASDAVFFGPDTCRFVSAIRSHLAVRNGSLARAADVGCGAGPGGIVIGATMPSASVMMVDINDAALRMARINAALNGTANVDVRPSNILQSTQGSFDLIVSNPPYLVDASERAYRHGGGFLGEGLSLAILNEAIPRLAPGGTLLLYTGSAIVDGVDRFLAAADSRLRGTAHPWSYVEVDPDVFGEELETEPYSQADRIAAVVLTVRKK